mgnify:CR=1 FL=1
MYSLSIKNISKTFSNGFKVLDNISFDIEQGDIFGFLGPNGSGKTTTIRIILGLIKANSGEVIVNGINIKDDKYKDNLLVPVFRDGKILKETSLAEIRNRLHNGDF